MDKTTDGPPARLAAVHAHLVDIARFLVEKGAAQDELLTTKALISTAITMALWTWSASWSTWVVTKMRPTSTHRIHVWYIYGNIYHQYTPIYPQC